MYLHFFNSSLVFPIAVLFLFVSQVSGKNCLDDFFDKKGFSEAIQEFKKNPVIPKIIPRVKSIPETDLDGHIPMEVIVDFYRIQKHIFSGVQPFSLKACRGSCGGASAVIQASSVFIEPSYIQDNMRRYPSNWRSVIRFLLAHEIAHFIHEIITLKSQNGLSPQNHIPLLREFEANNFDNLRKVYGNQAIERFTIRASKSHREVDGIALIILEEMGYRDTKAAYQYSYDKMVDSASVALIDTTTRAESIKKNFIDNQVYSNKKCEFISEDEEFLLWREKTLPSSGALIRHFEPDRIK